MWCNGPAKYSNLCWNFWQSFILFLRVNVQKEHATTIASYFIRALTAQLLNLRCLLNFVVFRLCTCFLLAPIDSRSWVVIYVFNYKTWLNVLSWGHFGLVWHFIVLNDRQYVHRQLNWYMINYYLPIHHMWENSALTLISKSVFLPPIPRWSSFIMMLFWKYGFRLKWKRIL